MAIDSAAKRRSITGVPFFVRGPGVTPTVVPDATWRRNVGYTYSFTVTPPPTPPIIPDRGGPQYLYRREVGSGPVTITWRSHLRIHAAGVVLVQGKGRVNLGHLRVPRVSALVISFSPLVVVRFRGKITADGKAVWPYEAEDEELLGLT